MNPDKNQFEALRQAAGEGDDDLTKDLLTEKFTERLIKKIGEPEPKATLVRADGSPVPEHWPIFKVGEEIVVKNYVFRVAYIGETTLLLEPVRMAP